MDLNVILQMAVEKKASDIHLKVGIVPVMRCNGKLEPIDDNFPSLTANYIEQMAKAMLSEEQYGVYLEKKELDIGLGIPGLGRFRINIFRQRGTTRIVIRIISHKVPQLQDLNLPPVVSKISNYERGLVLVTGATGSGKSSTLAAIVDHINRTKSRHILTLEDPIEFLIRDRKSIITQRELGVDAPNFSQALRAALRQDPDVILVGEMRDRETIETALVAAETGHLVLSTLHTLDARETINRILAVFEPHMQQQIRLQLASVLRAVVSQRLARQRETGKHIPVVEILINNKRIQEMIENPHKTREIPLAIEEGTSTYGMQSFDQSLMNLLLQNIISQEEAMALTDHPEDFAIRYSGVLKGGGENSAWASHQGYSQKVKKEWEAIDDIELESTTYPQGVKKKTK